MGKVKQLWQDEIDKAIGDYHDEIQIHFQWDYTPEYLDKAKKRLVSKLHALGCEADHIELIVDTECR